MSSDRAALHVEQARTFQAPTPPSIVSLGAASLAAQSNGTLTVKLDCMGAQSCSGKLTLQVSQAAKRKRSKRTTPYAVTLGFANFSIAAGRTTNVTIHLNGSGRALLSAGHGRVTAHLRIAQTGSSGAVVETMRLDALAKGRNAV
jgi:hypothetical protein